MENISRWTFGGGRGGPTTVSYRDSTDTVTKHLYTPPAKSNELNVPPKKGLFISIGYIHLNQPCDVQGTFVSFSGGGL